MGVNCQRCGQAEAEWKVKEIAADGETVRWWYLCDVCLLEDFGPWIGKRIPALEEGQMWSSKHKTTYQLATESAPRG